MSCLNAVFSRVVRVLWASAGALLVCGIMPLLASCGGGGGGSEGRLVEVFIQIEELVSGFDGSVDEQGNVFLGGLLTVGDFESVVSESERVFLSFDLARIPSNATIVSGRLLIGFESQEGDPNGELGDLVASHIDIGPTLEGGERDSGDLGRAVVMEPTFGGFGAIVTDMVSDDWDLGRARSQYRLQFSMFDRNVDGNSDYYSLYDSAAPDGNPRPTLHVEYRTP